MLLSFMRRAAVFAVLFTITSSGSGMGRAPVAQATAAAPAEVRTWFF